MILYKLTNQDGTTHGGMQWGPNTTHLAANAADAAAVSRFEIDFISLVKKAMRIK